MVLQHLRYKFNGHTTVPYHKIFNFLEGYTQPRTKVSEYHVDGMKHPEMVHAQYQDVQSKLHIAIQELLVEYEVIPFYVTKVRLIIGGDHRKGAFHLCFRIVINVKGKMEPIYKTKSIAEVYCAKEEGIILEKSIMSWSTDNLKKIRNSQLQVRTARQVGTNDDDCIIHDDIGNIVCNYSAKTLAACTIPNTTIIPKIETFVAGDLSWYSLLLGKEGSSSSY